MPELPEVEYTARQLRATVVGAQIHEALIFWDRTIGHPEPTSFVTQIAGRTIEAVRRRGKFLLLDLSGELLLTVHRRMTGNFLLLAPGWQIDNGLRVRNPDMWNIKGPRFVTSSVEATNAAAQHVRYCRVCFNLADGRRLLFTDPRKFGRIGLWERELEDEALAGLGPEPLSEAFTTEQFATALADRKTAIKPTLLAQDVVAGVGNIYADEALYFAAIHPTRPSNSLTPAEVALLREGIVSVLTTGIEHGGTSFNDYRDLWGEAGENYDHVQVYHKNGSPCPRCGSIIERVVLGQRGTHFCPTCQK